MNYKIFCCFKDHPTTLTEEEIENPFLVLNPLCGLDGFLKTHDDLWLLITNLFKEYHWMEQEAPLITYSSYNNLIRLLDAAWLLYKIRPDCQIKGNVNSPSFKGLYKKANEDENVFKNETISNSSYVSLHEFFGASFLWGIKNSLYLWCKYGLTPTDGSNDSDEVRNENIINIYRNLDYLIKSLHHICKEEKKQDLLPAEKEKLNRYKIYAITKDHPTTIFDEVMDDPSFSFYMFFKNLNYDAVHQSVNKWHTMLIYNNYWETHSDPGNILSLRLSIEQLIDGAWIIAQNAPEYECELLDKKDKDEAKEAKFDRKNFPHLTDDEFAAPVLAFENFFRFKPLHWWKQHLEQWTRLTLSNVEDGDFYRGTLETPGQLLKLFEASYIFYYS